MSSFIEFYQKNTWAHFLCMHYTFFLKKKIMSIKEMENNGWSDYFSMQYSPLRMLTLRKFSITCPLCRAEQVPGFLCIIFKCLKVLGSSKHAKARVEFVPLAHQMESHIRLKTLLSVLLSFPGNAPDCQVFNSTVLCKSSASIQHEHSKT